MESAADSGLLLGRYGYALATLAFLGLTAYLRPSPWNWRGPEARVQVACATTALWAALCCWHAFSDVLTVTALYLLDIVQLAAWLLVLESLAVAQHQPRWLVSSLRVVPLAAIALGVGGLALVMRVGSDEFTSAWLALLSLVQPLLGLLAVEQIYRNSMSADQRATRWLFLSIGGMFVINLFVAADSVIASRFQPNVWGVRGFVYFALAAMLYVGLRSLGSGWRIGLFLSRQVVFFSSTLLLVGVYLILMSFGAWAVRNAGGNWGAELQLLFFFAAGSILLVLIFSGAIRRRLMAFVSTHFFRNRYDYRIEWMRFVRTLSERSTQGNLQQLAIQSVAQIIESASGSLWLVAGGNERFFRVADWPAGAGADEAKSLALPGNTPLVDFMSRTGWVVDLRELAQRPELYDNAPIPASLLAQGDDALIVPLLHVDSMYGFMVLKRPPHKGDLHFEDRDLLKIVCRHLAAHLWQADIDQRLANNRQFDAYNRLTAFVMHDLKNLTAQLQLIVSNAARHKRNPEFVDDAIATIANSVERMGKLLSQLTAGEVAGVRRRVEVAEIVQRAALRAGTRQPVPDVKILVKAIADTDPERLATVLDHLIRNAQDATAYHGSITLEVDVQDNSPQIRIVDTGAGMDEEFVRERLFRPFDSTKGARGMGIGAYQSREQIRSLGGDMLVRSVPGSGTTITLVLPATSQDPLNG